MGGDEFFPMEDCDGAQRSSQVWSAAYFKQSSKCSRGSSWWVSSWSLFVLTQSPKLNFKNQLISKYKLRIWREAKASTPPRENLKPKDSVHQSGKKHARVLDGSFDVRALK
jgi:hypothetical protein